MLNSFLDKGFKENRWLVRYVNFITHCKDTYTHGQVHHILPQALFPEYSNLKENTWNGITLSNRAHVICHYMLAKAVGGSMWAPLMFYSERYNFNSTIMASAIREQSLEMSRRTKGTVVVKDSNGRIKRVTVLEFNNDPELVGTNKGNKEIAKKISKALNTVTDNGKTVAENRGKSGEENPMYGRIGELNPFYGKKHSEETKIRLSKNKIGTKMDEETKEKIRKSCSKPKKSRENYSKFVYHIMNRGIIVFTDVDQRNIDTYLKDNDMPSLFRLKKGIVDDVEFIRAQKTS